MFRCSRSIFQKSGTFGNVCRETLELKSLLYSPISFARLTESLPNADCTTLILRDIKFKTGSIVVHIPNLLQGASLNGRIRRVSLNECGLGDDHARLIARHLDETDIDCLDLTGNNIGLEGRKRLAKAAISENAVIKELHCDKLNEEDEKALMAYINKKTRSF